MTSPVANAKGLALGSLRRGKSPSPILVFLLLIPWVLGGLPGCRPSAKGPTAESSSEAKAAKTDARSSAESTLREASAITPEAKPKPAARSPLREVDLKSLTEGLRAANPSFRAEPMVEDQGGIIVLAINDPEIRDISPLAGLRIHKLDLYQCSVSDLTPLAGLPLVALALDRTKVTDLRPLAGMPLEYLSLSETEVTDLTPLAGCPLKQLNLVRTKVTNLAPLARCPLETLWLNDTPVKDLSPLRNVPLVSLTIAGTLVEDLSPLKGMPLKRLHIARSQVKDLTPLRWLRLERLVFTPSRIQTGMDIIRHMPTLREIGTAFGEADWGIPDRIMPPEEFWALYDAGEIKD